MTKFIRKYKLKRPTAIFLIVVMISSLGIPIKSYALTGGPSAPEFEAFKPIGDNNMGEFYL
ncbi:MAG: hypothetical protein IPL25_19275 [Saprospiraceae bacterium]|nr:hypothetical protein [Candidatus Vicinibacter affinis]